MDEKTHEFILSELSGENKEDDIIYSVCQMAGVGWEEARSMVEEVKEDHSSEIEIRQIPVKGMAAIVFIALGVILILEPAIHLWSVLGLTEVIVKGLTTRNGLSVETIITLIQRRCSLLSWFELPSIVFTMMTGAAIIFLNIKYAGETWQNLMYMLQRKPR